MKHIFVAFVLSFVVVGCGDNQGPYSEISEAPRPKIALDGKKYCKLLGGGPGQPANSKREYCVSFTADKMTDAKPSLGGNPPKSTVVAYRLNPDKKHIVETKASRQGKWRATWYLNKERTTLTSRDGETVLTLKRGIRPA